MPPWKIKYPFFLFLFPIFFVLHGFTENFYFVSVKSALLVTAGYIISSLVLTAIFYFFSRKIMLASIMASFIVFFQFFFGSIHDFIKTFASHSFLRSYSFILPAFFLCSVMLFVLLKKRKDLSKLAIYLNILFAVLILVDVFSLVRKIIVNKNFENKTFSRAIYNDGERPDIYIVLLDGYPGYEQLKNGLGYDNDSFLVQLASRNFNTIRKTHSNYLFTPYSIASILNMEYVDSNQINDTREKSIPNAFRFINNNKLISFFKSKGYKFYNYSIFQVAGQPAPTGGGVVPANAKLINGNTFLSRFEKDVLFNIATELKWRWFLNRSMYQV